VVRLLIWRDQKLVPLLNRMVVVRCLLAEIFDCILVAIVELGLVFV
jgi:hypothetical protein